MWQIEVSCGWLVQWTGGAFQVAEESASGSTPDMTNDQFPETFFFLITSYRQGSGPKYSV